MAAEKADTITVEIFGEKYYVRGEGTSEYIKAIASDVDKKMRILEKRLPRLPIHQLAILTALNFADDLAKLREEHEEVLKLLGEKTE